jgi:hypothetical protein
VSHCYWSVVVRCWQLADGRQRVEVEDLASQERLRFPSLANAWDWMAAREGEEAKGRAGEGTKGRGGECSIL